jgi:hypothetical protein
MDPGTIALIAAAVSSAAHVGSQAFSGKKQKKTGKLRAREMQRETEAGLINDYQQRQAEMEGHRLKGRAALGKRRAQSLQDTSDLLRGAFNI